MICTVTAFCSNSALTRRELPLPSLGAGSTTDPTPKLQGPPGTPPTVPGGAVR